MAKRVKKTKNIKKDKENKLEVELSKSEDLYISMQNVDEKRKNILYSIKNSLIMQDEYEKLSLIRARKAQILSSIKKELTDMNSSYQKIKKLLPNVKNVLAYAEKELSVVDESIKTIKENLSMDAEELAMVESMKKTISKKLDIKESVENKPEIKYNNVHKKHVKKVPEKLSKLDRIKNNLKVIESKLNSL